MLRHHPRGRVVVFIMLAMFLQIGASPPQQPQPAPVKLTALAAPYLTFSPIFIAKEEGYFAEQGLEVEFPPFTGAVQALPALAQGDLDVSGGEPAVNALNAIGKGINIKYVADKGFFDPSACTFSGFVARMPLIEAGEVDSLSQWKGKRVAVTPNAHSEFMMDAAFERAGLTSAGVDPLELPPAAKVAGLANGTLDLAQLSEPWLTRSLESGDTGLLLASDAILPGEQFAYIAYGPSILDKNPEAGKRFMVAYLKGVRQYKLGKTERNLEILGKYTGLDRAILEKMCWPPFRDDGKFKTASLLRFQNWAIKKQLLKESLSEDQVFDLSFVDYANQILDAPKP